MGVPIRASAHPPSRSNCHEMVSTKSRVWHACDWLCGLRIAFRKAGLPKMVDLDERKTNVRTGGSGAESVDGSRSVSKRSELSEITRVPWEIHVRPERI